MCVHGLIADSEKEAIDFGDNLPESSVAVESQQIQSRQIQPYARRPRFADILLEMAANSVKLRQQRELQSSKRFADTQSVLVKRSQATLADLRDNDAEADDVLEFHGLSSQEKIGVNIVVAHLQGVLREHALQFAAYVPSIKRLTPLQVKGIILDALSVSLN